MINSVLNQVCLVFLHLLYLFLHLLLHLYNTAIVPDDWSVINESDPVHVDIQLPEAGRAIQLASRNRNVILGLHHR